MDRNQSVGITLILLIVGLYLYFSPAPAQRPATQNPTPTTNPPAALPGGSSTPTPRLADVPATDSLAQARNRSAYGSFAAAATGTEREIALENADVKVTLSTRGGRVKRVQLKKYRTFDGQPLILLDEQSSRLALEIPTAAGKVDFYQLYFQTSSPATVVATGDTNRVRFRLEVAPNQYVEQTYALAAQGHQVGYDLRLVGLEREIRKEPVRFYWQDNLKRLEKDLTQSRNKSLVSYFLADESFEKVGENSTGPQESKVTEPIRWVSLRHQFFTQAIIARETPFAGGVIQTTDASEGDSSVVKTLTADLRLPVVDLQGNGGKFEFYFGPNSYPVVKNVAAGFGENVDLGWPVVRWINRFVTVPVFNFLAGFIPNYGVIIIVLVLLVKLILTPLTYRSYVSMAKMRVLQPELAEIKQKAGDDAAKAQQDQMKLYQQVGVSPLSGCIPVLLTMPILFAMFSFFPSSIELRQQPFLWSNDLSTYDSVLNLPFQIPFYGAHVSLFAILMTLSSIAYAYYNNQLTTIEGPMKTLGYIMPVVFLFVMNSFPAGLSFYYFVSNLPTIAQQLVIRRFVDEDKIKAVLEENRKNAGTRKKSKFQTRLEEAMKAGEEIKKKK